MTSEETPKKQRGMKLRWRLLCCLLFYGPAVYFKLDGDTILAAVCAVAGIGAFSGFRAGAAYIFTLLVAVTAAIALAPSIGVSHEAWMSQWLGTTGLTNRFVSIGVVGLLIAIAVSVVLITIARRVMKDRPRLENADRWVGFGVGGLEGAAAIVLFLGGMLVVEPIELERAKRRDPNDSSGRLVSKLILNSCEMTRESRIGPALVAYNPFSRIPQLNKVEEVQQSVAVLSDPEKIQGLLYHPRIRQLRQRPEVRRVVDQLTSDPEIRSILRSGKRMDRSMAMTLLSHPAVMELVDQPGFIEEASQIIQGTNLFRPAR